MLSNNTAMQVQASIQGVIPGPETEAFLAARELDLRTIGGVTVGLLAVAAYLFDQWTLRVLGVALGTTNLLLLVGLVTSAIRQVGIHVFPEMCDVVQLFLKSAGICAPRSHCNARSSTSSVGVS